MVRLFRSAAIAVAVASTACGGAAKTPTSPSQSTTSSASGPTAVLAIRSDAKPAIGAVGGSLTFDASESIGTGLTYSIDFGDGEKSTKVSDAHALKSAGAKTAKLTVTDSAGRASSIEVPYFVAALQESPSAVWQSTSGTSPVFLEMAAAEGRITGHYYEGGSAPAGRAVSGSFTGDSQLALHTDDGAVTLTGTWDWAAGTSTNCLAQSCVALRFSIDGGANAGHTAVLVAAVAPSPVARLVIPTDDVKAWGIKGYTPLIFDASASTGTNLTYHVTFGDGAETTRSTATHVGRTQGRFTAQLTVTDFLGRTSSAQAEYAVIAIETGWSQEWVHLYTTTTNTLRFLLYGVPTSAAEMQDYNYRPTRDYSTTTTVSGDRDLVVRDNNGNVTLEGRFVWLPDSNAICGPGQVLGPWCVQARMHITGGSADGQTWLFRWYDGG
jgi:PKD repeat protein